MERKKLMLVGGGDLCLQILKMLVPRDGFIFYVAGRDTEKITRSCNLLRLGCLQMGGTCTVYPVAMDLAEGNVEENAGIIYRLRPDIIFNSASLQSWRVITQLPAVHYQALDNARFGPWLPMQLAPAYELMRAIKQSGINVLTINAAFPDAVNAVLDKVGMAPDAGIGGVANLVPAVRLSIARLALRPPESVQVRLIAQQGFCHQVAREGLAPDAQYRLIYWVDNRECTGEFDDEVIFNAVWTHFRSLGGVDINFFNAISAIRLLENLHAEHEVITHVPSPGGLPGGYPVRVGMGQVMLALPYGVSRSDAIAVNQAGQRQDGIRAIGADGSVSFESENMQIIESLLGFAVSHLKLQDVHQCAAELGRKYNNFASAVGEGRISR
ncbi:hypothetical protein [Pseudomonas viridiflava]|uniref:hypothetical protein n=1 Tax=Pseudomonas viridiflava TaxID=33069 RepID=UPI000F05A0B2|nr:hypothetical protein [Pseudomonas viridiflava]